MHVVITSTIVSVIQLKLYILISSFLYILRVSFTGRNGQIYIFKNTYENVTLESVKDILSEEKISWREVNKRHLIGYDVNDNIGVEIIRDINTKSIIIKLEKDR